MKKSLLLIPLIVPAALLSQPYLSPTVISSGGGYMEAGSISLSYTIGEVAVQTLTSGSLILTQGFQQPFEIEVGTEDILEIDWQVKTWPNPVTEALYIRLDEVIQQDLVIEIMDLAGRIHLIRKYEYPSTGSPIEVDMTSLEPGIYLVKIRTEDQSIQRMVKILKE